MTVFIVRHGQTDYNLQGIVQGSGVDASLNETGRSQGRYFFERYQEVPFQAVLTSALRRTHETVGDFIGAGIPWEQHLEINEMGWGSHEGKKGTAAWGRGELDGRIGGGESARELGARVQRFIDHLPGREEELLLICSHGRAMCALVTLMMGLPLAEMNNLTHNNTGLWRASLQADGTWKFDLQNDLSHLPEVPSMKKW